MSLLNQALKDLDQRNPRPQPNVRDNFRGSAQSTNIINIDWIKVITRIIIVCLIIGNFIYLWITFFPQNETKITTDIEETLVVTKTSNKIKTPISKPIGIYKEVTPQLPEKSQATIVLPKKTDHELKNNLTTQPVAKEIITPKSNAAAKNTDQLTEAKNAKASSPTVKIAVNKRPTLAQLISQGELLEAEKMLLHSLNIDPGNLHKRATLIDLYLQNGRYEDVIEQADNTLKFHPSNTRYKFIKAQSLAALNKNNNAITELLTISKSQLTPESMELLGALYQKTNNYKKALLVYQNLTNITPDNATAWAGLGISQDMLGLSENAIKNYTKALNNNNLSAILMPYINSRLQLLQKKDNTL